MHAGYLENRAGLGRGVTAPYFEWGWFIILSGDVKVPRRVIDYSQGKTEVQCDASEYGAYGAVVYIRETRGNFVAVKFLTSKARVASLKHTTTPKL